jgi:hypothetical protein
MDNICAECEEVTEEQDGTDLCLDCYSHRMMREAEAWYLIDTGVECHCSGCFKQHDPRVCPHRV